MTSVQVAEVLMESDGEGSPVVMVHGLGGTSNTFQPLLAALAGFRVVRPDFPGSGRSPPPPQPITLALLLRRSRAHCRISASAARTWSAILSERSSPSILGGVGIGACDQK